MIIIEKGVPEVERLFFCELKKTLFGIID